MTEQVTDSRRISGRGYDALDIKERTEQMVASLRLPAEIPYRFDAVRADDRELIRYGLPPRPNPDLLPRHFDKWTRALSQPIRSVRPAFTVTGVVHVPVAQLTEDNVNSATWSGAVVQSPPPSETFKTVSARWIVPNAWPPASAWNGNGWNNGTYHCSTWVGIDGWNGINELLQGGTASEVVVSGGQITSQRTYAWFEWWPAGEIAFTNLTVKPGDLVNCLVCAPNDSTHGFVSILNEGSRQTASTGITAPGNSSLAGTTAEWITEDPSSNNQPYPMPDYGATFFYDALAGSRTQERDISNAVLVNMVSGGATLSAAAAENNRALLTYAGDHGP